MNTDGMSDRNDYGEHSKRSWWAVSIEKTGSLLDTNIETGLNSNEVSRRLERYGANELAEKKQISMAHKNNRSIQRCNGVDSRSCQCFVCFSW
jgi:magnesium-transporting ATPase (P-type)